VASADCVCARAAARSERLIAAACEARFAILIRLPLVSFAIRAGTSFAEFAHQLAPRKAIVIGRDEHHLEAMIFRGERVAGFVLDFDVEASGK
jgi:hypothetical protein